MKVTIKGQLVQFHSGIPSQKKGGGIRGDVQGFSRASRKRMIESLLTLEHESMGKPIFVTLTYPALYPSQTKTKQHLRSFWVKLQREYGRQISSLWKMELQKRGAPHYHLLIWGVSHIDKAWLSRSWFRTVGSGDRKHLLAGTKVENIRTVNGVIWYAAKYMTKEDKDTTLGRVWGWLGRQNVIKHSAVELEIGIELFDFYGDEFDSAVQKRASLGSGFSLYGRERADTLLAMLDDEGHQLVTYSDLCPHEEDVE